MFNHISKLTTKTIFLLDGIGAMLSTMFLACIAYFFDGFGLPLHAMSILIALAATFMVYSLACYLFVDEKWRACLWLIVSANAAYSLLTMAAVIHFWGNVNALGVFYFVSEIMVIYAVVYLELSVLRQTN